MKRGEIVKRTSQAVAVAVVGAWRLCRRVHGAGP